MFVCSRHRSFACLFVAAIVRLFVCLFIIAIYRSSVCSRHRSSVSEPVFSLLPACESVFAVGLLVAVGQSVSQS